MKTGTPHGVRGFESHLLRSVKIAKTLGVSIRLGITALKADHQVEIFLMNEGSELDTIPDSKDFDISVRVAEFKGLSGEIFACGTCLKVRGKEESKVYPISTMSDLLKMIESPDKVLVFG